MRHWLGLDAAIVWPTSTLRVSTMPRLGDGFLRAEGELDLGYCEDAGREHAGHYQDFAVHQRVRRLPAQASIVTCA